MVAAALSAVGEGRSVVVRIGNVAERSAKLPIPSLRRSATTRITGIRASGRSELEVSSVLVPLERRGRRAQRRHRIGQVVRGGWAEDDQEEEPRPRRCRYRPWAELMMRTFAVDVLCCLFSP